MGGQTTTQDNSQKSRTTNTSTYSPFGGVGNQLNQGLGDAGVIYDRMGGDWRSFGRMGEAGLAGFNDLARNTPNLASGAIGDLNSLVNRSGLSDTQERAMYTTGAMGRDAQTIGSRGMSNPALKGFASLSGYQGPSYSERNLGDIASGQYLNREDPNFERVLGRATERAATEAGMAAAGMGRTGSPYHQSSVAQTVGDLEAGQRVAQYQRERDAQVQANQLMDATRQGDMGLRLNALSGLGGTYATGIGQALQGNAQRMGALGSQYNMAQGGINNHLGLGQGFAGLYGGAQQPNTDLFEMRNLPFNEIGNFLGMGQFAQPYGTNNSMTRGTQVGTQSTQQPTNWAGLLGGLGLGAASLLRGGL